MEPTLTPDQIAEMIESGLIMSPADKPGPKVDRLSIHFAAHHEQYGEPASVIEVLASSSLKSQSQAMLRRLEVPGGLIVLDPVWIEEPGSIVIENRTGLSTTAIPDAVEKERLESCDLQVQIVPEKKRGKVDFSKGSMIVRPKMIAFFGISPGDKVMVNVENGPAQLQYMVIPR